MSVTELRAEHLAQMPVFPLPKVSFLPDTTMPLHIFEPRYRALVAHCLRYDWPMAVARIVPGREQEHLGAPPFLRIAGAGDIVFNRTLDDGKLIIVLRCLARVRLTEVESGHPWRVARAVVSPDTWGDGSADTDTLNTTLVSLLRAVSAYHAPLASLTAEVDANDPRPEILTHAVAVRIAPPEVQQKILETTDVTRRVLLTTDLLADLLVELAGPGTIH